jgi:hypothetical protein
MVVNFDKKTDNDKISIDVFFHGFDIKEILVRVSPKLSLKRFVQSLIDKFGLEQIDSCGFVGYHVISIGEMPNYILEYYDEEGNELTFESYGIINDSDVSIFYAPGASTFLRIE